MRKKDKTMLLNFSISLICFFSSVFVYIKCSNEAYEYMFVLPMVFLLCYIFFLRTGIKHFKEFNIVYTAINFVRFVVLPCLIVITGRYDGRSPNFPITASFNKAFFLMSIELILCSFLIFILSKLKRFKFKSMESEKISLPKFKSIYVLFIIFVLFVILARPNLLKAFSFLVPNDNMLTYDSFEIIDQIFLLSIITGKQLFFVLICSNFYKKYKINNKKVYIYLSGLSMLINCFIYFGYNRSDFLMNLVASLLILLYLYKKESKKFIKFFAAFGVICIVLISQVRNYRSISKGNDYLYDMTDNIQIYLAGPYDVAIAVETAAEFPEARDFKHLVYDFGRSTLGLNVIFKNFNLVNSNKYYNLRLFRTEQATQIMPVIGEGYFFFGSFFAPLIEILFIVLAYSLRKNMSKNMQIELVFFFTITIIRIGFISAQNASIQMNDLSFNLFLPLILFFISNLLYQKKARENYEE